MQEDEEDEFVPNSPIGNVTSSSINASTVDTSTLHCDSTKVPTPEQTLVIPPKDSLTKSSNEEVRTSGFLTHVSNMDVNVNETPQQTQAKNFILKFI